MTVPVVSWGGGGTCTYTVAGTTTSTATWTVTTNSSVTWTLPAYTATGNYLVVNAQPVYSMDDRGLLSEEAAAVAAALAERQRIADEAREAAEAKADALLLSLLPADQKERYRLTGVFEIIGSHGTRYRIRRGIAGNIDWLDSDGKVGGNLCCHAPVGWGDKWLPAADVMVGQVLALRTDEPEFLRVANGRKPSLATR